MQSQVGTLEYLAPEVLLKQPYGYPADIYSWAVSVNEIATAIVPFSDCTKDNPAAHTVLNFGYGRCWSNLQLFIHIGASHATCMQCSFMVDVGKFCANYLST